MEAAQTDVIIIGRILLAGFFGFVIGWERESQGSAAGDRTHALVAIGAATFAALGAQLSATDASRIVQGIIAGIGFLGGGIIMRTEGRVIGLTTAAGIWGVAALGVVVGSGEYVVGAALFLLVLLVLAIDRVPLLSRIAQQRNRRRREQVERSGNVEP